MTAVQTSESSRLRDLLLPALCLAAALGRWLTRSHLIYAWDSVHYVLAQARYDIPSHQPHPPGSYYYVLLARLGQVLTHDPHGSLLLISALSGGALAWALFHLGRELADERAGWLAAVIGATAPIFWFFGSVGLNYGPSGALAALFALLCLRASRGDSRSALLAGALLGVIGGFRPTDQVFLLPAYAWSLHCFRAANRQSGGTTAASLLAMGALTLGWMVPNAVSCGGLAQYVESIRGQEHLIKNSSVFLAGWPAWQSVLYTHRRCLESALGAAWLPVGIWVVGTFGRWLVGSRTEARERAPGPDRSARPEFEGPGELPSHSAFPTVLLALLIAPAFLFYLLVHFNSPGYALTYSGVLAALAGVCVSRVAELRRGNPVRTAAALALLIGVGNTALFLWGWPGVGRAGHRAMSWVEIRDHDRYYAEVNAFLRGRFAPSSVRVLSSWNFTDGLRIVETLLPGYERDVAQAVGELPELPPAIRRLSWLRLMTPEQLLAEGRPIFAVERTREDPPYHRALFAGAAERVPIGPGHTLLLISPGARPTVRTVSRRTAWPGLN